MADPTPQQLSDRIDALDKRVVALETDDAKVHGFIALVDTAITNNPKVTALVTAILTALLTYLGARFGLLPNPTPPAPSSITQPVGEQKSETAKDSKVLDEIRGKLK